MLDRRVNADVPKGHRRLRPQVGDQSGKLIPESADSSTVKVEIRHASATSSGQSPLASANTPVEIPVGWCAARGRSAPLVTPRRSCSRDHGIGCARRDEDPAVRLDEPGGRRSAAHTARRRSPQHAPHRDARQDAVFVKRGFKRTGRTGPFSASSEGRVDVESQVFMGIYRHLLGPHEQRKSGGAGRKQWASAVLACGTNAPGDAAGPRFRRL